MRKKNDLSGGPDQHVKKDVALEALRGFAALVVVAWHFIVGFAPGRTPFFGSDPNLFIVGRPWSGLIYGTSAVTFFFVLSGFVLSRKALVKKDPLILARGAIKRWPRLAGPVLIAVLFSWFLFVTNSYHFFEAGNLTHSPWLSTFADGIPAGTNFKPSLLKAFKQGYKLVFFKGDATYDSSLWTMRAEFIGSFLVFGIGALMVALRQTKLIFRFWLLAVILMICDYIASTIACFVIGLALAVFLVEKTPRIPTWCGLILALFALWLIGYYPGLGWYGRITTHLHFIPDENYVHAAGSVIAIFLVESTPRIRRALSGRISGLLGKLSFPVYLLHIPILCSVGSFVFLAAHGRVSDVQSKLAAGFATLLTTVILAAALAVFDTWWVRKLGAVTDKIVPALVSEDERAGTMLVH